MSSFKERLDVTKNEKFPRNPCKFMKIWMKDGQETYDRIMNEAVFATMDNGAYYEMEDVAEVLNEDFPAFLITKADVFKHRNDKCIGCHRKRKRTV